MKPARLFRYYTLRLRRLRGPIGSLARGAALGAGVAITPTMPLHTAIIVTLAWPCRANLPAAVLAGFLVSNPLTVIPQYFLAWRLGSIVLPGRLRWERIRELLQQLETQGILDSLNLLAGLGWDTVSVMMAGGLMLAIPTVFAAYVLAHAFFSRMRERPGRWKRAGKGSLPVKGEEDKARQQRLRQKESG